MKSYFGMCSLAVACLVMCADGAGPSIRSFEKQATGRLGSTSRRFVGSRETGGSDIARSKRQMRGHWLSSVGKAEGRASVFRNSNGLRIHRFASPHPTNVREREESILNLNTTDIRSMTDRAALRSINLSPVSSSPASSLMPAEKGPPQQQGVVDAMNVNEDVAAAGILASSAVIFELVQLAGTTAVGYLIHTAFPDVSSLKELIESLSGSIQDMGGLGYLAYIGVQMVFQIFPIASAFAMTMSAGVVFGSIKNGVFVVSLASTCSAAISFVISRYLSKGRFTEFKEKSTQLKAIDTALGGAGFVNSLLLMVLLRSSPVIPFSWANYLFGASKVPLVPFVLGTFFGTLPGITAMVSAGKFGEEIFAGGSNNLVVQAGLVATILSIVLISRISEKTLEDMDIQLNDEQ